MELTNVSQVTTKQWKITSDDIRRAFKLPESAQIEITIPSGADWSGMTLDLDQFEHGIQVTVVEKIKDDQQHCP